MEFAILGAVDVHVDGRSLRLGGPKPRALLAILLLNANAAVSRDRLIDGLWGEAPPATAAHTLDDYVSRLRKELGSDRIERRPPGYVLRVEPGELDLEQFETLGEQGRRELALGDADVAAATFRAALGLWRGRALEDVLYEPFASLESERLEERRLALVEDRLEADLACGQGSALVAELHRLTRDHPLRERLLGQLMLALYRSGQQAKALELFQASRRRLAEEFGLEPGPQLRTLERHILEQDGSLDAPAPSNVEQAEQSRGRSRRTAIAATLAAVALAATATTAVVLSTSGSVARGIAAAKHDQLVGLDAESGRMAGTVTLSGAPAAIASGNGSFWVADADTSRLLRVDPKSGAVLDRIPLATQPGEIAVGGGAVWVANTVEGSITRIDPATGKPRRRFPSAAAPAVSRSAVATSG